MAGPWDINGVEWTDDYRVTSPEIQRRLWILMGWAVVLERAKNYLVNCNLIAGPRDLPGLFDFSKRVYFHLKNVGYPAALPLIESDRDLFKSWAFSGDVLAGLALLQGVRIHP